MRTMTDNEFQRLKGLLHKKIIEVDALRKLYREQTGRDYVLSGNLPEKKVTLEDLGVEEK